MEITISVGGDVLSALRLKNNLSLKLVVSEQTRNLETKVPDATDKFAKIGNHLKLAEDDAGRLWAIISRHLPSHWDNSEMRFNQVFAVVWKFLSLSHEMSVSERHIRSAHFVAEKNQVKLPTVHDKCGRQLYGTGGPGLRAFRSALERIEHDWHAV